jgi:hypothetical protein
MARSAWVRFAAVFTSVVVICLVGMVAAGIPAKINYQGRLTGSATGLPLGGLHTLTFGIYDAASGGHLLWSETKTETADSAGVFATILGSVNAVDIVFDGSRWLEIEVDGETLSPRREMVSVPYAFRADNAGHASGADSLDGYTSGEFVVKGEASSITAAMIVGGTGSGLDADKVDGEHANAFADTAHNHDGRYYTEAELSASGAINQAGNPVDWTKLKGVPAGFVDGVDNVGPGDGYSLDAADGSPTDVVYVAGDGNVGIGTTAPTAGRLVVLGSNTPAVYGAGTSSAGVFGFSQDGDGVAGVSNNGRAGSFTGDVFISGNLGLGTASPAEKVDVDGNVNIAGSLSLNGYRVLSDSMSTRALKLGFFAAQKDTGLANTFVGNNAGNYATGGSSNTVVGSGAGLQMTETYDNTFIGADAGAGSASGAFNTCVGTGAGWRNTTGDYNTCIGGQAGFMNPSGSHNTLLGMEAGFLNEGSGNLFLGNRAGRNETGSNKLYIANGPDTNSVLVYGDFLTGRLGLGTLAPERKLHIKGDGPRVLIEASAGNPEVNFKLTGDPNSDVWAIYKSSITEDLRFYQNGDRVTFQNATGNVAIGSTDPAGYRLLVNGTAYATGSWQSSDLRLKTDLQGIDDALGKVLRLRGVSFRWRRDENPDRGLPEGRHYGLVAQEVETVLPEVVGNGPDGEKALAYSELIPVLVEAVKELKAENEVLKQRLDALERAR